MPACDLFIILYVRMFIWYYFCLTVEKRKYSKDGKKTETEICVYDIDTSDTEIDTFDTSALSHSLFFYYYSKVLKNTACWS